MSRFHLNGTCSSAPIPKLACSELESRPDAAEATAADRDGVTVDCGELDDAIIARPLQSHHPVDIDDVAAVHANEPMSVEPRLDIADRERAKQLGSPVEDIRVMCIGMDGDDVVDGDEMRCPIPFDREVACLCAGGRAGVDPVSLPAAVHA